MIPNRGTRTITLALALGFAILLAACGGSGESASEPGGGAGQTAPAGGGGETTDQVDIAEFNFKPASITVKAGTKVTWTNRDNFAHTVQSDDDSFPTSSNLDKDQTFSHTFDEAGSFSYICGIHNSMTGTVTVT